MLGLQIKLDRKCYSLATKPSGQWQISKVKQFTVLTITRITFLLNFKTVF